MDCKQAEGRIHSEDNQLLIEGRLNLCKESINWQEIVKIRDITVDDDVEVTRVEIKESKRRFRGIKVMDMYRHLDWLGERLTLWHMSLGAIGKTEFRGDMFANGKIRGYSSIERKGHEEMVRLWQSIWFTTHLHEDMGYKTIMAKFKAIGMWFKLNGVTFFGSCDWMQFVSLETIGTYVQEGEDELFDDAITWLDGNIDDNRTREYRDLFPDIVVSTLKDVSGELHTITVDQFIDNLQLYATSGAAESRGDILIDGERAPNNKWNQFISMDVREIKRLLLSQDVSELNAHVFGKEEHAKVRGVMKADTLLHLKFSFLEDSVEQLFDWDAITPMFRSQTQRIKWWRKMMRLLNNSGTVGVPFDQGKFDHNVTMEEILVILKHINNVYRSKGMYMEEYVLSGAIKIIETRPYYIHVGDKKFNWGHGIPSGFRWTALLDTLVNMCQFYTIYQMVRVANDNILDANFMGDDIASIMNNKELAVRMVAGYLKQKLDPSVGKWSIQWLNKGSGKYVEFLRTVVDGLGIHGYSARCISSIFEIKPTSVEVPKDARRLQSTINNWKVLLTRSHIEPALWWSLLIRDIRGAINWKREDIEEFLLTDSSLGGGGFGCKNKYEYTIIEEKEEIEKINIELSAKDYSNIRSRVPFVIRNMVSDGDIRNYVKSLFMGKINEIDEFHHGNTVVDKARFRLTKKLRQFGDTDTNSSLFQTYFSFVKFVNGELDFEGDVKYRSTFCRNVGWKFGHNVPATFVQAAIDSKVESGLSYRKSVLNVFTLLRDYITEQTMVTVCRLVDCATTYIISNWIKGNLHFGSITVNRNSSDFDGIINNISSDMIFDRMLLSGKTSAQKNSWLRAGLNLTLAIRINRATFNEAIMYSV